MGTIPLIEDNVNILENLTEYLELKNYSILLTTNGKCGLEFAKEFKPDLIICDVLMPEMSSLEVLSFLWNTSEIPFIFSTPKTIRASMVPAPICFPNPNPAQTEWQTVGLVLR